MSTKSYRCRLCDSDADPIRDDQRRRHLGDVHRIVCVQGDVKIPIYDSYGMHLLDPFKEIVGPTPQRRPEADGFIRIDAVVAMIDERIKRVPRVYMVEGTASYIMHELVAFRRALLQAAIDAAS